MSDREQFEEIGRIVVEHRDSTRRLAALQSQMRRASEALQNASRSLNRLLQQFDTPMLLDEDLEKDLEKLPERKTLESLLVDAREEAARLKQLDNQKKQFGI